MSGWSGLNSEDNKDDPQVLKLETSELKMLEDLCNDESSSKVQTADLTSEWFKAMMASNEAEKERNKFCLELERKYEIKQGTRWNVDFKAGGIVVEPVKPLRNS